MSDNFLKLGLSLAAITAMFVFAEPYLSGEKSLRGEPAPEAAPDLTLPERATQPAQVQTSSSALSLRKSPDGQFWAEGQANNGHVKFLVDTGASVVALTADDARKAGLDLSRLKYDRPVNTANGQIMAAYVRLDKVSIGSLTIRNVDAMVIPEGLHVSLLGMSYLGRLQKVEATPDMMILRL